MKVDEFSAGWQLGYTDGNNGNEERHPHNANYMAGYKAGCKAFSRWIDANMPFESMTPAGANDAQHSEKMVDTTDGEVLDLIYAVMDKYTKEIKNA